VILADEVPMLLPLEPAVAKLQVCQSPLKGLGTDLLNISPGATGSPGSHGFRALVFFAWQPRKRGLPQENRITLTVACRCNGTSLVNWTSGL